MTDVDVRASVRNVGALDALARRLERAAATLQASVEAAVRAEGEPAAAAVRAAWLGVQVSSSRGGGESSGLRARVAAATRAEPIPSGVRIRVDSGQVDPVYGASLVRGLDGQGVWAHPVFGRSVTVVQSGQEVFYRTLQARRGIWERRLERVIEEVAREIEG